MKSFKSRIGFACALVLGLLVCGVASANPVTMNFNGLTPGTAVSNYYGGGCSKKVVWLVVPTSTCVDSDGPAYGVVWSGAYVTSTFRAASTPNYVNPRVVTAAMNVMGGFDTKLSFDYAGTNLGRIEIYSGFDGSGMLLASVNSLPDTVNTCGKAVCWDSVDLYFAGTAQSVIFAGVPVFSGFDNVTIGVPEPAVIGVFGFGLLLIGAFAGLRRRGIN